MSGNTTRRRVVCRLGLAFVAVQALGVAGARPAAADIPGAGIIKDALGGVTGWAFDKVAEGISNWVLGAVEFFVNGALDFLRTSARPDVESVWFAGPGSPYATVRNIAGVLLLGFVFLGLIQGLVQADPGAMVRRIAGNLPVAVAGMIVTTAVVGRLLELTDALSDTVLSSSNQQTLHFLSGFGATVTGVTGGFAAVLLGLVAVIAALLLWVELIVRSSLVYLLVAISPLGFAASLWPSARGFLRKTVEVLIAVILSKFVIAIALAIGVAALSGAGSSGAGQSVSAGAGGSLGTLLVGAVLLGLAAFSPFLVLKLVPVAEAALLAHGISRGPVRAAQTGLSTYSSTRMISRLSGTGPGGSAGGGLAGQTPGGGSPSPVPTGGAGTSAAASGSAAGPAAAVGGVAVAATAAKAAATTVKRKTESAVTSASSSHPSADAPAPPRRLPRKGDQG